jgi:hypothetical protein
MVQMAVDAYCGMQREHVFSGSFARFEEEARTATEYCFAFPVSAACIDKTTWLFARVVYMASRPSIQKQLTGFF